MARSILPAGSHLGHPGGEGLPSFWPPSRTLCGLRITVGVPYQEVEYAGMNPNNESCPDCDFALFVERGERAVA